jgi:hypothetical protein
MALQQDLVEPGRNQFDEPIICCAHCHQPANYTQTVDAEGRITFELMCPFPGRASTLGTWVNEEQRIADIRQFLERVPREAHL